MTVFLRGEGDINVGRVTIAMPHELQDELKRAAREHGWSMNAEVLFRLQHFSSILPAVLQQNDSKMPADIKVTAIQQQNAVKMPAPEPAKAVSDEEVLLSWRERAEAIDRLPNGGDKLRPSSDFQQRRRKQVELLQEAWLGLGIHTAPLTEEAAKRFLVAAEDWCEVVVAVFEYVNAGGKSGPGMQTYISKCIPDYLTKHKEELSKKLGGKHYPTTEELAELEWAKQAAIDAGLYEPGDEEWA